MKFRPAAWVLSCLLACSFPLAAAEVATTRPALPPVADGGTWDAGHVQGIAVDRRHGYLYYSFTTLLAKYDFSGRLIGTLSGWHGHLGDLDFNQDDGKLYGSLEYKADDAFYIAVIDVDRLDRVGLRAQDGDLMRAVYLSEVNRDFVARVLVGEHRYGCSGIDGVGFGPAFGRIDGPRYLTVAYGIYGDVARSDNDHQVLLQYDVRDWARLARPLDERAPHHSGPAKPQGKYFLRTGNTTYGVQTLAFDEASGLWFLGVYPGHKPAFPNYGLFAVDGRAPVHRGALIGVPGAGPENWETGLLLRLADVGQRDATTGIRGWYQKADVGLQPAGQGLFYLSRNSGGEGAQHAELQLMRWTGQADRPFVAVDEPGKMDARTRIDVHAIGFRSFP